MEIIKNWFDRENYKEFIIAEDNYIHRIIKVAKLNPMPKEIEIGINMSHSNHYITPKIVHQDDTFNTYVLSYYNGINSFDLADEFIYSEEMKEAHNDALKAGYAPVFGFDDVTTNEKDEIVVINVEKFK